MPSERVGGGGPTEIIPRFPADPGLALPAPNIKHYKSAMTYTDILHG